MERGAVRSIHFVRTEHTSRTDHADRHLACLHNAGLHRRRLSTKNDLLIDIEGILLILCGMVCRNIQKLKIVFVVFDLRSFQNFIAHTGKNTLYLLKGDGVGMTVAQRLLLSGKGHIDNFFFQTGFQKLCLQITLCLLQTGLDLGAGLIYHLSNQRTIFLGYIFHTFQYSGQLTFFAEKADSDIIQFIQCIGFLNSGCGIFKNLLQSFFHHITHDVTPFPSFSETCKGISHGVPCIIKMHCHWQLIFHVK